MSVFKTWVRTQRLVFWLPLVASICVVLLGWLSYRAIRDADRTSALLAQRTAQEAANLLAGALLRDMRAVQQAVLVSHEWNDFSPEHPYRVRRLVATAFAQYPYPETFLAWRRTSGASPVVFWSRAERLPRWAGGHSGEDAFPVAMWTDEAVGRRLMDRITTNAATGQSFAVFDTDIDGDFYQVVTNLRYFDPYREQLATVIGFLVNLGWVRQHYFADVTAEMARVIAADADVTLKVLDERGQVRAQTAGFNETGVVGRRQFPLSFFDPLSLPPARPADLVDAKWTAEAVTRPNRARVYQPAAAAPTLVLAASATVFLLLGLFLTARAVRESATLAETRATFVATVTHELKTPVAGIRAAGDTLASGRVTTPEVLRDYAVMVVNEAKRLTRLLDNLLAYARITDLAEVYSFQLLDLRDLIDSSLREFRSRLESGGFEVRADIESDLPEIKGDRTALALAFDNVLDNAIRYSGDQRVIEIHARSADHTVTVEIVDHGIGILPADVGRVKQKFFRGRNVTNHGSGLGLAITDRIISDHGGALRIRSTAGSGTTVILEFLHSMERV